MSIHHQICWSMSSCNLWKMPFKNHKLILTYSLWHFIVVSMVTWWVSLLMFESFSSGRLIMLLFTHPASFCSSVSLTFSFSGVLHCQTAYFVALLCIFPLCVLDEWQISWLRSCYWLVVAFVTFHYTFLWGKLMYSNHNGGIHCESNPVIMFSTI